MITRISGRLEEITGTSVHLDTGGGLWYEVLVCSADLSRLAGHVGEEIVLHTIHLFEGDPTRGNMVPRLIGFAQETDREFFLKFTTVKGIGVRKALRALVRPIAEIAAAIESKDDRALVALPEIGRRTAERIIAELHGKVADFAGPATSEIASALSEAGSEAVTILVQLGEKRADASALIERVLAVAPELDSPQDIIQQAYRLKSGSR